MFKKLLAAGVVSLGLVGPSSAATIDLGFAIDESGSVTGTPTTGELGLLRGGLAAAMDLIPSTGAPGNPNVYTVTVVRFAGSASTLISKTEMTDASRASIKNDLTSLARISGGTNIPAAVTQLTSAVCGASCTADTTLFNIATDGAGGNPTFGNPSANQQAVDAGVDGISYEVIGGGLKAEDVKDFALPQPAVVVTDPNNLPNPLTTGFALEVSTFTDFENAIAKKVGRVVTDTGGGGGNGVIPLPAGLPLLLTGLGLLGFARSRRKAA